MDLNPGTTVTSIASMAPAPRPPVPDHSTWRKDARWIGTIRPGLARPGQAPGRSTVAVWATRIVALQAIEANQERSTLAGHASRLTEDVFRDESGKTTVLEVGSHEDVDFTYPPAATT